MTQKMILTLGELAAELPFVLMHPKVVIFSVHLTNTMRIKKNFLQPGTKPKIVHADSQADVECFRQDTVDQDSVDCY